MARGWILSLILLWTFDLSAECSKLHHSDQVRECHFHVPSQALQGESVYVRAWVPEKVSPNTRVILFLHGRGYAHSKDSSAPTMVEAAGLEEWFESDTYKHSPAIVLSPQDLFVQDGNKIGNDYWLGADGRNWELFFTEELKPAVEKRWGLPSHPWVVAGISMGAHGAMKLAVDYPDHFKAFASISPVFRSSPREIEESDRDVFYAEGNLSRRSIGARLLSDSQVWSDLQSIPHWIDIHQSDFALGAGFPDSGKIWPNLLARSRHATNSRVEVVDRPLDAPGHSMTYWRERLPIALDWLVSH